MAISLKKWTGALKELLWRQQYNENMTAIETAVDTLEANSSLLKGSRHQVAVTSGLGTISASALGVTDVSSHRWVVQAEYKDAILFVCPRLYSSSLTLYVRNQVGQNPPDGTYPINVMRLS